MVNAHPQRHWGRNLERLLAGGAYIVNLDELEAHFAAPRRSTAPRSETAPRHEEAAHVAALRARQLDPPYASSS